MRILELRFKNLNSLYGEWVIDFTAAEYVANNIFALTGPTGAGKSTILDAICLALYGATPRLGKITRSGNEIMSRRTGECYAEVLFESQTGRFRCHWEQRRARKKADGKLQDQEHQIADEATGKPVETKKSLVSGIIEEKTGMDFDRFTRSILLAQGGFDTFLKADVEQKSKILEQITGTEIYSEISRRVHERQRDERDKLNLLRAETSAIVILETDQEDQINRDLEAKRKQEIKLIDKVAETGKAIAWLTTIAELKKEISSLAEEAAALQRHIDAFKPERDKMNRAIKAATLDGLYATLTAIRKQQADDQASLKAEEAAIPALKAAAGEQASSLKSAELQTIKAKEELTAAAPLLRKIRFLDQKISEREKAVLEGEESCTKDAAKIDADKQSYLEKQEKLAAAEKKLELADSYLREHAGDEWLISGLAGVEERLGSLLLRQKEIAEKQIDHKKADAALKEAATNHEKSVQHGAARKRELEDAIKKSRQGKDALSTLLGDRLLREYRTEKEALLREMAFLSKIAELEDHRARLEDGKPCPLCGATEHPFAEGNVPAADETEQNIEMLTTLINKAEDLEEANKQRDKAEAAARQNLTESEKREAAAVNDKQAAEKTVADLTDSLEILRDGFAEQKQALSAKLQPLGITKIPDDDISSLLESLAARLNTWQEHVKKKAEIEEQIANLNADMKRLDAIIETQSNALAEKREQLATLKKECDTERGERRALYDDKKPDDEEDRLNKAVATAEEAEKEIRTRDAELQRQLASAQTHVESLNKRIDQRAPELEKVAAEFSAALARAGFAGENEFLVARLSTEQRDTLSARAKELDDGHTDLKARQKDRESRLKEERAQKVTGKTRAELEPQLEEYEESAKQLRDAIAALKHKLEENNAAKERVKNRQTAIEAQQTACHRWEKLHGLIGSADGKKYRTFAQGLTFELMVSHANRQLEKMSDRYLLIRDDKQPLELNVIDNYQAGEVRSTRNLSGGESFIVSLTLALGLSKMASRNVRVDSLFLDEGFGTLDEDSLETALETLSGLQQDNKLIGVISHIPALKDRISTQITIEPESGGKSTLTGPGCALIQR